MISELNLAAAGLLGVERKSLVNKPFSNFIPAEFQDAFYFHRHEVLNSSTKQPCELVLKKNDGTFFHAQLESIGAEANGQRIMRTVLADISERRKVEDGLRESEKRYRSLFDNMLNGFAYCRMFFEGGQPKDFVYLRVNRAFETLTGLKNVTGKRVSEVIPGIRETDPQIFEVYGRVAFTGVPERFETFVEALKMWFSISVYSPGKSTSWPYST